MPTVIDADDLDLRPMRLPRGSKVRLSERVKEKIIDYIIYVQPMPIKAAEVEGIHPLDFRKYVNNDEDFRLDIKDAMDIAMERAENALWDMAVEGEDQFVMGPNGLPIYEIDPVSGQTTAKPLVRKIKNFKALQFLLRNRKEDVYGERSQVQVNHTNVLIAPSQQDMESYRDVLRQHRQKTIEHEGGNVPVT